MESHRSELKGAWAHQSPPLPGPQFSHLRNGNMTYITGLFKQLCKMWPDMINSGEIQSTAKAILVFDGWVWGEVRAKYRGLQRRPQELSRWQQLEAPSFLIGP